MRSPWPYCTATKTFARMDALCSRLFTPPSLRPRSSRGGGPSKNSSGHGVVHGENSSDYRHFPQTTQNGENLRNIDEKPAPRGLSSFMDCSNREPARSPGLAFRLLRERTMIDLHANTLSYVAFALPQLRWRRVSRISLDDAGTFTEAFRRFRHDVRRFFFR